MKHNSETNTVAKCAKYEGNWVRIEEVKTNRKNRQMWNFGLREVEFGIGSSMNEIC